MIKSVALAALFVFLAHAAVAQHAVDIPRSTSIDFTSKINAVDYRLYVQPPRPGDDNKNKSYPILIVLDADYAFPIATAVADHFVDRNNLEPIVVVGIAYPGAFEDLSLYRLNRSRDYTPVFHPSDGYGPEFQKASGGAKAFLKVIQTEILPLISTKFHGDITDTTITGHSFGGLFGSWVLATAPESFKRYILISPSLWYGDKFIFSQEISQNDESAQVFLGVGRYENQPQRGRAMVDDLQEFARRLENARPNTQVIQHVFEDETHNSVFPAAFTRGLRQVFAPSH